MFTAVLDRHVFAGARRTIRISAKAFSSSSRRRDPANRSPTDYDVVGGIMSSLSASRSANAEAGPSRRVDTEKEYSEMFGVDIQGTDLGARPSDARQSGPGTRSSTPRSLQNILYPSEWTAPPRPNRIFKGVHRRTDRSKGTTPHENAAFNEVLNSIIADLDHNSPGGSGPFTALSTRGAPWGFRFPGSGRRTVKERKIQPEEDERLSEELYALKEEMCLFSTDVELLEWTKRKVFTPLPADAENPMGGITFPRVYPRILAHVIKTLRVGFNNPQLAMAVFHYAQTHSLESYLMGCLAPAYNELITIRWDFFRDLEGVEQGVMEMQMAGVAWDRETRFVVGKVVASMGEELLQRGRRSGVGGGGREGRGGLVGDEVYDRLKRLEERVQEDMRQEERMAEIKRAQKIRMARREDYPSAKAVPGGGVSGILSRYP